MIRWLLCGVALYMTGELAAQTPVEHPLDRRMKREKAVEYVGAEARSFVESPLGDEAAAALLALSKSVAVKLVAFYNSGGLGQLPRAGDLLRVISQQRGNDIALWAIDHAAELSDRENMDAYLASPCEYTLKLKFLVAPTPETRAAKDRQGLLLCGAWMVGVALIVWWRRRKQMV
jgi:hypothetical protein